MKRILLFFILTVLSFSLFAADGVFDYSEHNWNIGHDKWKFNFRNHAGGDESYFHVEGKYQFIPGWTARLRWADDDGRTEIRPRLTTKVWSAYGFTLASDVEYRIFEGNKDNYWRFRPYIKYKTGLGISGLSSSVKWAPRWHFQDDSQHDDFRFVDSKFEADILYKINENVSLGPTFEYVANRDWERKDMIWGTELNIKF